MKRQEGYYIPVLTSLLYPLKHQSRYTRERAECQLSESALQAITSSPPGKPQTLALKIGRKWSHTHASLLRVTKPTDIRKRANQGGEIMMTPTLFTLHQPQNAGALYPIQGIIVGTSNHISLLLLSPRTSQRQVKILRGRSELSLMGDESPEVSRLQPCLLESLDHHLNRGAKET